MQRRRVCAARWSAPGACTRSGRWSDLHIQRVLDWGEHLQRHHGQRYGLARVDISACGGSCQQRPLSGKAPVWAIGPTSIFTSKAHVVGQQVLDVAGRARARDAARGSPRDTRKLDEPLAQDGARAPTRVDFRARCGHCAPLVKLRLRRLLCPEKCTTMAFWPRDVARRPARRAPLWRFGRETSGLCEKEINFLFQKRTDVSRPKRHSGARLAGRLATSRGQNAIVVQNSDIRWENCRFHAGVYAAAT